MNKKKFLTRLVACVAGGALLLGGCAQNAPVKPASEAHSASSASQGSEDSAPAIAQGPGEKTAIEYWHVNAETQGGATVEALVNAFNAQSDTAEVTARYNPDMYKGLMQNLQAEAAAGKSPAVVQVGWAFLDYFSNNFAYTYPQEIIDRDFPEDTTFLSDNFLPNIAGLAQNSNGDFVGLPYSLSNPVLYLNQDMLREAGLSEDGPKTWTELREFAAKIKETTGNYGFYMQEPADTWAQQALVESNGARFLTTANDTTKATFASDEGIAAFELYAGMVLEDKSALHTSWDEGIQSFISGKVGMLFTTIAQRKNVQTNAQFKVTAVNAPAFTGKQVTLPSGGCFLAVTAQTPEEQKATWEFLKYIYSVESIAEWTKGTGYVPPRQGVTDSENGLKAFLAENKMMEAATTQMDKMVKWASFPGDAGLEAEQLLLDMRDQILGGNKSARDAMSETQEKINQLLG